MNQCNYDYIIHTRSDQYYVDYLTIPSDDKIIIPKGEDYFGLCDRFILFHSKYAKKYFSLCEFVDSAKKINKVPDIVSPESVLKSHLENENLLEKIVRIERINFTVSKKHDATRWRVAKYRLHFKKVMIKYPDEFISSVESLIDKYGIFNIIRLNFLILLNYKYLILRRAFGKLRKSMFLNIK